MDVLKNFEAIEDRSFTRVFCAHCTSYFGGVATTSNNPLFCSGGMVYRGERRTETSTGSLVAARHFEPLPPLDARHAVQQGRPFRLSSAAQVKMRGKPIHFACWTPLKRNPTVLTAQRLLERVSRAFRLGATGRCPPTSCRPVGGSLAG